MFLLQAGVWKVVQWHSSIPSHSSDICGVHLPQSLSDLIDSLDASLERSLTARQRSATVTLLISDIEGSTSRGVTLGDAVWSSVVQRHFDQLERIADAHDGTVIKTMGDGALIAFDSAVSGARAAVEIQRAVEEPDLPDTYLVRVGVHTGEVVKTDDDYFGFTVNKTARLAAAAAGGQILVSDTVHALIAQAPEFTLGNPVSLDLKGLPGAHQAYSLTAAPLPAGRMGSS